MVSPQQLQKYKNNYFGQHTNPGSPHKDRGIQRRKNDYVKMAIVKKEAQTPNKADKTFYWTDFYLDSTIDRRQALVQHFGPEVSKSTNKIY